MSNITTINDNEKLNSTILEFNNILSSLGDLTDLAKIIMLSDENFKAFSPYLYAGVDQWVDRCSHSKEAYEQAFPTGLPQEEEISLAIQTLKENLSDEFSQEKTDFLTYIVLATGRVERDFLDDKQVAIQIFIETENEEIKIPFYAREGDAGMDVYSPADYSIDPGKNIMIPLGFKIAIPQGYAMLVLPRSGNSLKTKLRISNSPGLIDSGYRNTVGILVDNIEPPIKAIDSEYDENGKLTINSIEYGSSLEIPKGMKIAQLMLIKIPKVNYRKINDIMSIKGDRGGGFGHTDS